MILTPDLPWDEGASSSGSDVDRYIIIIKSRDSIFNIFLVFIHTNRRVSSVRLRTQGVTCPGSQSGLPLLRLARKQLYAE